MRLVFPVAVAAIAVDQASKWWMLEGLHLASVSHIDVAPPYLRFVMAWNQGINFGVLAAGSDAARLALIGVSLAICVGLILWARGRDDGWFLTGIGLVVGGALGNALDRAIHGAVVDFLNMSCCGVQNPYVFNIADVFIFVGAALLILRSGERKPAR